MKNFLFLFFSFGFSHLVYTQDIHWSQIYANPTYLNPSMNGLFDGDIRMIANARSQWDSFTNGYKTVASSMDVKLISLSSNDFIGSGLQLFSDKSGDLNYKTQTASLSFSYVKSFDKHSRKLLSFGIQNNFFNNSLDLSKAKWPIAKELSITGDVDSYVNYWSISAGVSWFYAFDRDNSFYVGTSIFHLNNPNQGLIKKETLVEGTLLNRKYVIHGGGDFRISDQLDLKPSFSYMQQGPSQKINTGLYVRYNNNRLRRRNKKMYKLYLGAWIRGYLQKENKGVDAVIGSIRIDIDKTFFSFSYDVNISKLRAVSFGQGGSEISIIKILDYKGERRKPNKVKCPFKF